MPSMSATEQEVLNCERQYWQAMLDKDANIANHLTD